MKRCQCCKQEFEATTDNFYRKRSNADGLEHYCKICRRAANRRNYQIYSRKEEVMNRAAVRKRERRCLVATSALCYTVIRDPDQEAGFFPGAELPRVQVAYGLRASNFTPGTVLQDRSHRYQVVEERGKQLLVEVSA
jgi:hypothetical protein